jgi:tetratricopeptide (TPR) repeat protein
MGFLQNLLRSREKQHLENSVVKDATPEAFLRLARLYEEEGDLSRARQVIKRGTSRFPQNQELAAAEQDVVKLDREAEIVRLRQQIEKFPNRGIYARLADQLRICGKNEEALSVVSRGLKEYPDYGGLLYVSGEIEHGAGNLEAAFVSLSKAVEFDKFNYAALRALGQVAGQMGRHGEAAKAYSHILEFAPDDTAIRELLAQEEKLAQGMTEEAPRGGAGASVTDPDNVVPASGLSDAMRLMVLSGNVQGAVLVDGLGSVKASHFCPGVDASLIAAATASLRSAASPACGELGLGAFEEMLIDSQAGAIFVFAVREMTLGVLAPSGTKQPVLERAVADFIGRAHNLF